MPARSGSARCEPSKSITYYLAPQSTRDGTLLYIRRPYVQYERVHPVRAIKNVLLFPFRLLYAVVQYLNYFSAAYTGRKLTSSGAKGREMDLKQMMIWGNLVRAQQPRTAEEASADLVPKSWQLCRSRPNGETEVLANAVLAYDIDAEGRIVYTNGNAVFLLRPDGHKEHLLSESMIEQVCFVATG
jgi:hypothetical protein